jgi:hypothetical protein
MIAGKLIYERGNFNKLMRQTEQSSLLQNFLGFVMSHLSPGKAGGLIM